MPDLRETVPGDELFPAFCAVWEAVEGAERPGDPVRPRSDHEALGRLLLEPGGARDGTHRVALVAGEVVGALRTIVPTQDNTTTAILDIAVHPDARRRGVGTLLLEEGVRLAAAAGRDTVLVEVDEPDDAAPGRAFATRHGFTCDLAETWRRLALPVPEQRLAQLATPSDPGYAVVSWRDRTPDSLLEDRALLEQRMSTDAPYGDLPLEEERWDGARIREYEQLHLDRGRTVLSAGAVHQGQLVAFTDLQVPLAAPTLAHQGGTLVLREHRGHRLGGAVKVAVLRELAASGLPVRSVVTVNAETNAPMVRVNEALGFAPAGVLSTWSRRYAGSGQVTGAREA